MNKEGLHEETLHTQPPIVEFKVPLDKGNHYTDYNLTFSSREQSRVNNETLQRLNNLFPKVKDNLSLLRMARTSVEATDYHPTERVDTLVHGIEIYGSELEGRFAVPWEVELIGVENQVLVGYKATLVRPDKSHGFRLFHTKIPDFLTEGASCIPGTRLKTRTQIDGLPVHLRLDEVEEEKGTAKRLSIISRGIVPADFRVGDGSMAKRIGVSNFEGKWIEKWYLNDRTGKMQISDVDVKLQGNWV